MSTMEQHFAKIKISVTRMLELDLPQEDVLLSQKESFRTILKLDTLQETMDQIEDHTFAMSYYMLNHKIDHVESISQKHRQIYESRMDWNNVLDFFNDIAYTISVFKSVYTFAKLLEGLCLIQDQINSQDLREGAEKLKSEAEFIITEEEERFPVLKKTFEMMPPFPNWSTALVPIQQKTANLSSKLKDMRVRCTKIVEDLCTKQMQIPCFRSQAQFQIPPVVELESVMDKQLELIWRVRISSLKIDSLITRCSMLCERLKLLQKGVDSPDELIGRSSHFIFSKFLKDAAYTIRVLEDLVNTSKYLEDLVKQDEMSSDKLKAKAGDLMLRIESTVKLEDQLLSQIRDEHEKIATLGADARKWSKVLGLVQQNSVIILSELEFIRYGYTKIAGNLYDIDKQRTEGFAGG